MNKSCQPGTQVKIDTYLQKIIAINSKWGSIWSRIICTYILCSSMEARINELENQQVGEVLGDKDQIVNPIIVGGDPISNAC